MEVIIVASLIGILATTGVWSYRSLKLSNEGSAAVRSTIEVLRRAQLNARGTSRDLPWGVRVSGLNLTLFTGTSYDARLTQYDETTTLPNSISLASTQTDTIFSKLTGNPDVQTQLTVTTGLGLVTTVSINGYGLITY
jgi:type II secretory pathway pseudopilin PulG